MTRVSLRGMQLGIPTLGGVDHLTKILSAFTGIGDTVALARHNLEYYLAWESNGETWFAIRFADSLAAVGQKTPEVAPVATFDHRTGIHINNASRGGTWGSLATNAASFQNGYRMTETPGATATFITPDGVTDVGFFCTLSSGHASGGIITVSIDGDSTIATSLPTAQDLYVAGRITETARDNLGATTRCFNQYQPPASGIQRSPFGWFRLASDLAPGIHTIVFTLTTETPVGSTGRRFYISGIYHNNSIPGAKSVFISPPSPVTLLSSASRNEFAFYVIPDGATDPHWIGHTNTEFNSGAISFVVDGNPVTPAVSGDVVIGSSLSCHLESYYRHPQTGATNIASGVRIITVRADTGVHVQYELTWLVDAVYDYGYHAMLGSPNVFNRGSSQAYNQDYTLDANDGVFTPLLSARSAWLWQQSGDFGALIYLSNLAPVEIQDRSDGSINKIYSRYENGNITATDIWIAEYYLRFQYFTGGAESTLAR